MDKFIRQYASYIYVGDYHIFRRKLLCYAYVKENDLDIKVTFNINKIIENCDVLVAFNILEEKTGVCISRFPGMKVFHVENIYWIMQVS